ncbi:transcriptional regulator [Actinosynnema sp. NPDC020468]|uniref:winged helix-turn-helix domain-containing protein n=1 Tax=Actinosynnema sp. NPDC020468 TaxID=3154488 RepID=UPI0033F2B2BB
MSDLDPTIHPLPRLSLCAALAAGPGWSEFSVVRDTTGLSDSGLSKHAKTLEEAGYLAIRKGRAGRRPRTWLRLTPTGRARFEAHVAALGRLTGAVPVSPQGTDVPGSRAGGRDAAEYGDHGTAT